MKDRRSELLRLAAGIYLAGTSNNVKNIIKKTQAEQNGASPEELLRIAQKAESESATAGHLADAAIGFMRIENPSINSN